jgi:rhamnose transport system permease protein
MIKRYFREWSVAAALLAVLILLASLAPGFFKTAQILSLLSGTAPVLIVACGVGMVIIARQIDISVGAQFALCSVFLGLLVENKWPLAIASFVTVLAGGCLGAVNGALVAGLGIPSIVVTLATMVTWRESLRWWRQGEFVRDLPETFQWFGLNQSAGQFVVLGSALLLCLFLAFALKRFAAGRFLYATGSDTEAARLCGIRPARVTFGVFVLLGMLTGTAALLNAVRFTDVDPKSGTGLEMQAIAAAVVGGVAISGGRGNLWGVIVGSLLLACIGPALVFLRMPPQWEKAFQGAIILGAVAADGWRKWRANRTAAIASA